MVLSTVFLGLLASNQLSFARLVTAAPSFSQPRDEAIPGEVFRRQIEEDWLKQAQASGNAAVVSTQTDARGACDGIKNGKFGFHTAEEPNPWWQVDLGATMLVSRILIFNRLDYAPGLHNADKLRVFTSSHGQSWTLRQEIKGEHFDGIKGTGPLKVNFADGGIYARFIRLQIPSDKPIYLHLDEVEIFGPGAPGKNLALHRPADQSSVSRWSTVKRSGELAATHDYPTAEWIERGKRLLSDLQPARKGEMSRDLEQIAERLKSLPQNADDSTRRSLYFQTRWIVRRLAFSDPLLDFDRLLFVKRFTQETYADVCLNHMPWVSRPGGDLCVLSSANGEKLFSALATPTSSPLKLQTVLNRSLGPGHVHGMDLSWDGRRVLFGFSRAKSDQPPDGWLDRSQSYRLRRSEEPIHIFEIDINGKNLRQITAGEWSDLDPTYAPNGDIVFVSERCGTSLQCNEYDKDETSCNLYVMNPDGTAIRRMSANKDGDYLPHTLDDGTIGYTRWEYHERSWAFIQSIWTIRPDGTGADAIFKQHFANPWSLEDTRSIPASNKLVAIAAGHHTLAVGPLVVVDPSVGINEATGIGIVTPGIKPPEGDMSGVVVPQGGVRDGGGYYSTPWALSDKHFLVSYTYADKETDATGYGLYLVDVYGNKELIYRDPAISTFIPIPLRPRPQPPILPKNVQLAKADAECVLNDASFGSEGLAPDRVRFIRISEPIGWPYDNDLGGQRYGEDHRYGGPGAELKNLLSWTPIRVLGDVSVEADGSAHFKVPADTAVYFQLLDENRMELRRMRSFISFQPGEVRACAGCHESRGAAPISQRVSIAANRAPSEFQPPPWGDRPVSFLRDIQPVLDRNCVSCHTGLKPAGGIDLSGGLLSYDAHVPDYGCNRAYATLIEKGLVSISKVRAQDASITPPLAYGSHKSKLIEALSAKPHRDEVKLTEEERLRLVIWIDANAPYHDRFVNKRAATQAYDFAADENLRKQLTTVHERRCGNCHQAAEISRLDWIDFRQPQRSLFLSAPLATEWGGTGRCRGGVYRTTDDEDYRSIRQLLTAAVQKAQEAPRRDLRACFEKELQIQRAMNAIEFPEVVVKKTEIENR